MSHSIAIVIMNGKGPPCNVGTKLESIINNLYVMDVKMAVLVNKTSREIKQCIKKVTEMNPEEVLDIICVIEAPRIGEQEFKTEDGRIDLYEDILAPLYSLSALADKTKLIITSGTGSKINVNAHDSGNDVGRSYGKNIAIVTSEAEGFTETVISELVNERGDVYTAFNHCSGTLTCTVPKMILTIPKPRNSTGKMNFFVS